MEELLFPSQYENTNQFSYIGRNFTNSSIELWPRALINNNLQIYKFTIKRKTNFKLAWLAYSCDIIDRLGNRLINQKKIFSLKSESREVIFEYCETNNILKRDLHVIVKIMTEDGKLIRVTYVLSSKGDLLPVQIAIRELSLDEKDIFAKELFMRIEETQKILPKPGDGKSHETTDTYVDALNTEIRYLKREGKEYKVSNGKLIVHRVGKYFYNFDLESELYLMEDSPITFINGLKKYEGNVYISNGTKITLCLSVELERTISSGRIKVEPWKLLEKLRDRISIISENDKIAYSLINDGPALATNKPISSIPKGQENAIRHAMENDITIVWGPPGTGKTYTMATMARKFVHQGKRVLIVSHSNISVDNVIKSIGSQFSSSEDEILIKNNKVLRYGFVRDNELQKMHDLVSFNAALTARPELQETYKELSKQLDKLNMISEKSLSKEDAEKKMDTERCLQMIRSSIKDVEKSLLSKASIIGTTISKVSMDSIFDKNDFEVVMFDEVSMAYVPQIIFAASIAKKHFICVGDFRQLSPIVTSPAKDILSKDIFSYLNISTSVKDVHPHKWFVMLDEQRRMHPAISKFSSIEVYNGLLKDHETVKTKWNDILDKEPFGNSPMNMINLAGTYCAAGINNDNSHFNILSALITYATAKKAYDGQTTIDVDNESKVGIITPYAAQTRLIRALMQDDKEKSISCATVHQFQGSERNVIVFDAVESYPSAKTGWLLSKNDNGSLTRLVNVALTRSRSKFIAISNYSYWENCFKETTHLLYLLLKYIKNNGNVVNVGKNQFVDYINTLDFGKHVKCFSSYSECKERFMSDVLSAGRHVHISVPMNACEQESLTDLHSSLKTLSKNGIKIYCKSKVLTETNKLIKDFAVKSDDANFPLILIDNDILWYGLPIPTEAFWHSNHGVSTNSSLYFRITGENTIDIIKSLTNLNYSREGNINNKIATKNEMTFRKYINSNKYCPKCGEALHVATGKSGKSFLKCKNCDYLDYLSDSIVNYYITRNKVSCPICGSSNIEAKFGPYGLYVKCNNCNKNSKLTQI